MKVQLSPGASTNATDFHSHHAIQITLSLGGQCELRTKDKAILGDVVVAPDVSHIFEASGQIALLFVEPESQSGRAILKNLLAEAPLAPIPEKLIPNLIEQLATACCLPTVDEESLEALGRSIVRGLAGVADARLLDERIRKIIGFAASHLDGPISLGAAAKHVGLSTSRARHLFVEQVGLPFRTYLLWLRIIKALNIYSTGQSLTYAAHEAGFADSAHFSRTFRRMFGVRADALQLS
ncbi:MAG: AraC family transcriptional regulator [Pseudomonadota bacterium]